MRGLMCAVLFAAAAAAWSSGCSSSGSGGDPGDGGVHADALDASPTPDASATDAPAADSAAADADPEDAGVPDSGKNDASSARRLEMNDVSILARLPVPPEPRSAFSWLVPRTGESGPYFPAHRIAELPILNGDVPEQLGYPSAMIVAVRYDPCFRESIPGDCAAQLRLVAQPVPYEGAAPPAMLDDSAVHLFYALSPKEARTVEGKLEELAAASPVDTRGPLDVHPAFAAEGSNGAFGAALRALIVAHCREDNLLRITVNAFAFDNWSFHRFEWRNDHAERAELRNMVIPDTSQAWLRQAQRDDLDDPAGTITPDGIDSLAYLLERSHYTMPDPVEVERVVARIVRIENPQLFAPDMVDCVSCHLSSQLHSHAQRHGISFARAPDVYQAPGGTDLTVIAAPELDGNLGVTIMFGYHVMSQGRGVFPSIGRRVIHETAEVVAILDARP